MRFKVKPIYIGLVLLVFFVFITIPPPIATFKESKVHLSFDDVEYCIKDLTENHTKYQSLFNQPFFSYIKRLHDKYNLDITLYTYADGSNGWHIENMTDAYKNEFKESSDWLKIGFHASTPDISKESISDLDKFKSNFNSVNNSISRFAGYASITNTLRLHYFFATKGEIEFLLKCGVRTLYSADDERVSYSLDSASNNILNKQEILSKDGMTFIKTDIRVENAFLPNISLLKNANEKDIVIFTHEWALNRTNKFKLEYMLWRISLEK